MVTTVQASLWQRLRNDWAGFLGALKRQAPASPGLYSYRIRLPDGKRRLQLRIDADGCGVLFVDAMDVVHLNVAAAWLAKLALDGDSPACARATLRRWHPGVSWRQIGQDVERIYRLIRELSTSTSGCPTCAVPDLGRRAVFATRASSPFKADLALTYGCNNACSHCYNESDRLGMSSLTKSDWYRVLGKLARLGVPHVIYTGGEATLHPDLPELIERAEALGQVTGLNTNGRRIAQKAYMRTLDTAGLDHVQITLASHRPGVHDAINGARAFQQTIRGIENALASGVHTITNTTLMRANMHEVEPLIDFLHDLGIRTFAMNGMIYSGGGFQNPSAIQEAEMAPLLVRVRDKAAEKGMRFLWYTPTEYCRMSPIELEIGAKRCNAGEHSICVEPNGDVLPCQSYYVSAGNILRDPWEQIWQGELFRSFRDREDDPCWAGLPKKCWECPDLPMCGGGCRIEREARDRARVAPPSAPCSSLEGKRYVPVRRTGRGRRASGQELQNIHVAVES